MLYDGRHSSMPCAAGAYPFLIGFANREAGNSSWDLRPIGPDRPGAGACRWIKQGSAVLRV